MSLALELKEKVLNGYKINKEEALKLYDEDYEVLTASANEIREHFCKNKFHVCTIINAKSGKCSENCKFCAQSSHYSTNVETYPLLETEAILKEAKYNDDKGILRFSVVTSGKKLNSKEIDSLCETYRKIKSDTNIGICASHGLLKYEDFVKLKEAGVTRYHNNLETSSKNFKNICTTHTQEDKVKAIREAQRAGLSVCSGGIIGLGESIEDRIDLALEIRALGVKSIPVNVLNPIPNTPFADNKKLTDEDVCRTIAVFRYINPEAFIRLAGGRSLLSDRGEKAFLSGANAAISGDMLTTCGINISSDLKLIKELGYEVGDLDD